MKEPGGGSTDSEEPAMIRGTSKRTRRRGRDHLKGNKCNTAEKKTSVRRRGSEGAAEASQRSGVADSCGDQGLSVSQEERMTCSVREQPSSQETSRVHGERHAAAATLSRQRERERNIYASVHIPLH